MQKLFFFIVTLLTLIALSACAPKAAYQAQDSMQKASEEASCQATQTRKAQTSLKQDSNRMQGDIKHIKEAERLFDTKSGIVLSY